MKQIKTIYKQMHPSTNYVLEVQDFDRLVNEALAEGWTLTKRDVFHPCDTEDYYHGRVLYAELEREVVTEIERICENCAHFDLSSCAEPCASCSEMADKWEPSEGLICE